jgi:hypothetical protein
MSSGLPVAERADEPARLGAVEHDGRGLAVPKGAEADERGPSFDAHVRAVLVRVEDERRAELRGQRCEGAARLRALLERARVVAKKKVDLAAAGEALQGGPLARCGAVPVATGSRRPYGKRAAVGEAAQTSETEAGSGRQVVQAVAERHRPGRGSAGAGVGERLAVVVVSVHEQKLEARATEQGSGGAKEAAPRRVARPVVKIAEGDERVAALLDRALDQGAQVGSVTVQVAENEQPAHQPSLPPADPLAFARVHRRQPFTARSCHARLMREGPEAPCFYVPRARSGGLFFVVAGGVRLPARSPRSAYLGVTLAVGLDVSFGDVRMTQMRRSRITSSMLCT